MLMMTNNLAKGLLTILLGIKLKNLTLPVLTVATLLPELLLMPTSAKVKG